MAWLVAYNENLFDGLEGEALAARLTRLLEQAAASGLILTDGREAWRAAATEWVGHEPTA